LRTVDGDKLTKEGDEMKERIKYRSLQNLVITVDFDGETARAEAGCKEKKILNEWTMSKNEWTARIVEVMETGNLIEYNRDPAVTPTCPKCGEDMVKSYACEECLVIKRKL